MSLKYTTIFAFLFVAIISKSANSQTFDFKGQVVGWTLKAENESLQFGGRYVPQLEASWTLKNGHSIDFAFAANTFWSSDFDDNTESNSDTKLYRGWARYAAPQWEIRIGLQKINFGPGRFFRPLMWFDNVDQRDPLQLTDGVYAALVRYYFQNNANLWGWILYGNEDRRGLDLFAPDDEKPEFGARFQMSLLKGEIGISAHRRHAYLPELDFQIPQNFLRSFNENRIAIDGRWDFAVGLWFENDVTWNTAQFIGKYQQSFVLGSDYTIPIANGIGITGEYFQLRLGDELFGNETQYSLIAASANYSLNLFDSFTTIFYYDDENQDWYRFFNWQRTYNNWQFNTMAFWNPTTAPSLFRTGMSANNSISGKGVQVMVVFNH